MADTNTAVYSEDEYREFTVRAGRLQELKIEFAYEVEKISENNTYKVTIFGNHDWDKLDELTNDIIDG